RYPYIPFAFYFSKLDWQPNHEIVLTEKTEDQQASLSEALAKADADNFEIVLYQVAGDEIPQVADFYGFVEGKIFRNDAHTLIVYFQISTAAE
ncbi:MAG: hypothetical protein ACXW4Q_15870, partial [Anaerolineales bacterium]